MPGFADVFIIFFHLPRLFEFFRLFIDAATRFALRLHIFIDAHRRRAIIARRRRLPVVSFALTMSLLPSRPPYARAPDSLSCRPLTIPPFLTFARSLSFFASSLCSSFHFSARCPPEFADTFTSSFPPLPQLTGRQCAKAQAQEAQVRDTERDEPACATICPACFFTMMMMVCVFYATACYYAFFHARYA